MDLYKFDEGIHELIKLERKLRMFWFWEGRHISYEEAVIKHGPDAMHAPNFKPKYGLKIPHDFKTFLEHHELS